MAKVTVPLKEFDRFVELTRTHAPDRLELVGHPDSLIVCVKAYDPSPGREVWIDVELIPQAQEEPDKKG